MRDKRIVEVVRLVDEYDQRLGRMSIREQRERYGGFRGWSRIHPDQMERVLSLMAEDGIGLVPVGEAVDA